MKKRAFTLLEVAITLIVICVVVVVALYYYNAYTTRAKSAEALVNINAIKKGEEAYKLQSGTYVNAADADQINLLLAVGIRPRYYEYTVVGATADNFLVVAKLIGEDLSSYTDAGAMQPYAVIAMDRSGDVNPTELFATTGGQGSGVGGGGGGWGAIGGISSWVGGPGTGGGGGEAGGGGGGGGGGWGGGGGLWTGGTGGGIDIPVSDPIPPVYNATIQDCLNLLRNMTTVFSFDANGTPYQDGAYFYSLIATYGITVAYADLQGAYGQFCRPGPLENGPAVYLDSSLQTEPGWPVEALTCVLLHELVHADIFYDTVTWTNTYMSYNWRMEDGTPVTPADFIEGADEPYTGHIRESVHQEFFTNWAEGQAWIAEDGRNKYNGVVPDEYTIYTPIEGGYMGVTYTTGVGFENAKQTRYELGEDSVLAYLDATYGAAGYPDF